MFNQHISRRNFVAGSAALALTAFVGCGFAFAEDDKFQAQLMFCGSTSLYPT